MVIETSSQTSGQVPPSIVQRKTLVPVVNPVTDVVADDAFTIVPEPLLNVQIPPDGLAERLVVEEQIV